MTSPEGSIVHLVQVMRTLQQTIDDFFGDGDCEYMISMINAPEPSFVVAPHRGGTLLYTAGLNESFYPAEGISDPTLEALAGLLAGALNTTLEKMHVRL